MYEVRADLKDTGKTRGNGHLFVDLWGLCERGVGAKEVDVEHGRAGRDSEGISVEARGNYLATQAPHRV